MGCIVLLILAFIFRGAVLGLLTAYRANWRILRCVVIFAQFGILGHYRYPCIVRGCGV